MIASQTPADPLAAEPFLAALRHAGATSKHAAMRKANLPSISNGTLAAFLAADIVRAAGQERYYLVKPRARRRARARFTPTSVALLTAFWAIALLLPLLIFLITG